jgi:hypothetical protein
MNWIKFLGLRFQAVLKKKSSGTTFIEVLVAITILSIIGIAISTGFTSSIILFTKVPQVVNNTLDLLLFENTIRKQVARVKVPFWIYDYKPEEDRRTVSFPLCDGIPYKVITFDYTDNYIEITTSSTDTEKPIDPAEPVIKLGPYNDAEFEIIYDKDVGLTGLSVKATSDKDSVGEIEVYAKFEYAPFWKVK